MKKYHIDLRIIGGEQELQEFLFLCRTIQQLGIEGCCREIPVVVDGDGTGRLDFTLIDENEDDDQVSQLGLIENFNANDIQKIYIGE